MSTELHKGEISATRFHGGKARGLMIRMTDKLGNYVDGSWEAVIAMARAIVQNADDIEDKDGD